MIDGTKVAEPHDATLLASGLEERSETPSTDDLLSQLESILAAQARLAGVRDAQVAEAVKELSDRIGDLEDMVGGSGREDLSFGPFGIFHEDPSDGTYRLSLPLLLVLCGAMFGMLVTML